MRVQFQSGEIMCRRNYLPSADRVKYKQEENNELNHGLNVCDVKVGPCATLLWTTEIVCNLSMILNRFIEIAIV